MRRLVSLFTFICLVVFVCMSGACGSSGSSGMGSSGTGSSGSGSGSGNSSGNGGGSSGGSGSGGSGSGGSSSPQLTLVAANAIQAGVTVPDAVWAGANYVYLANFDGHLRVIDKHQSAFPVIADVAASSQLYSVRGDATSVYATANGGTLFRFSAQPPFAIQASPIYASAPLDSLDMDQPPTGTLFVSHGGAQSAADAAHVYVTELNQADGTLGISKSSGQVTVTYQGSTVDPTVTAVFDRSSGAAVGTIKNPTSISGGVASVSLYSQAGILALFVPGCCGENVYLYNATTLQQLGGGWIQTFFPDTVAILGKWLIVGSEAGTVTVYDISNTAAIQPNMAAAASINLRTVTGKTGPEDIEVRAIWAEDTGNGVRIYAGSSWGNSNLDPSYRAQLPSFFVLDLK